MKHNLNTLTLFFALTCAAHAAPLPVTATETVTRVPLQAFPLDSVTLTGGLPRAEMLADQRYLHALDSDRLLYNFRVNAGLPAPGKPLGGWESPTIEVRGHFVGHYLSACALMYRSAGDNALRAKGDHMVAELAKCQKAIGTGYLSAFPATFFDRLEAGKPVWAPYYTIHKIMNGLLDMYQYCGNKQALTVAEGMADYFKTRTDKLSEARMDACLTDEFGGMANVLYDLYGMTGRPRYLALAHRFDQASFLGPLALGHDNLTNIHANTHIPKILGAGRRYELLGDTDYRNIVSFFWDRVADHRSYATGGSNKGEFWGEPDALAHTLVGNNQETCTTYNMLKVTRDLIRWTGDPRYADYYERAYFNGILPAQNPKTGMMIYYLPLATGNTKAFGTPNDTFWCCYGTGVESFAKLGDSVYFHTANDLYVNLYVPSEVTWTDKKLRLTQATRFPDADTSTFTVHAKTPTAFTLRLHIPYWAAGYSVAVNGKAVPCTARLTSYLPVNRTWKEGDTVRVTLPMRLHTQPMPDDASMQAVMYGPIVLAGLTDTQTPRMPGGGTTDIIRTPNIKPAAWLAPVPGKPLTFQTIGQAHPTTFIPIDTVIDQPFGIYWTLVTPGSPADQRIQARQDAQNQQLARTIDSVVPNDFASEKAHNLQSDKSGSGPFSVGGWRDALGWFQYDLKTLPGVPVTLACSYWGSDDGRVFDILANGQIIATQTLSNAHPGELFTVEYPIPAALTSSGSVTIRFTPHTGSAAGGVFSCATLKP